MESIYLDIKGGRTKKIVCHSWKPALTCEIIWNRRLWICFCVALGAEDTTSHDNYSRYSWVAIFFNNIALPQWSFYLLFSEVKTRQKELIRLFAYFSLPCRALIGISFTIIFHFAINIRGTKDPASDDNDWLRIVTIWILFQRSDTPHLTKKRSSICCCTLKLWLPGQLEHPIHEHEWGIESMSYIWETRRMTIVSTHSMTLQT